MRSITCQINNIEVMLIHQPQAVQAAALWQVDAGSLQEPDNWPGLAHLLEHMLFRGSQHFPDKQRLMHWVPLQGGRLNATTRLSQSAYFFELPADRLAEGLARLTDMLVAPLFHLADITQELAVIDAEYRLLRNDPSTRSEAALLHQMAGDKRLHRFRIGNIATLGSDSKALQQALQQFHQQYYTTQNMRLYLVGPQSLVGLKALAQQATCAIRQEKIEQRNACAGGIALTTQRDSALQQAEIPQLVFSFVIPAYTRSVLPLLQRLLHDEAPAGLMAIWRELNLVDDIQVQCERLDNHTLWLRFSLTLVHQHVNGQQVEQIFFQWLRALAQLSETQRQTLLQQCQHTHHRLTPLALLQAESYGNPTPQREHWDSLLSQLTPNNLTRLWLAEAICGQRVFTQGLALEMGAFPVFPSINSATVAFNPVQHWPLSALPLLPPPRVPLCHTPASSVKLTLYPLRPTDIDDLQGFALQAQLRRLSAIVAWQGGTLAVRNHQGMWQIMLQGNGQQVLSTVAEINQCLKGTAAYGQEQAQRQIQRGNEQEARTIAIRRLLAQLPRELYDNQRTTIAEQGGSEQHENAWLAQLDGGDEALQQALSHLLSDFPLAIIDPPTIETPPTLKPVTAGYHFSLPATDEDNALLVFLPLAETQKSQVQALQPEFFHWMRVKNSIGYVAQCQWYQYLFYQGGLLLLQSPHYSPAELWQEVSAFFRYHVPEWEGLLEQAWRGEISVKTTALSGDKAPANG